MRPRLGIVLCLLALLCTLSLGSWLGLGSFVSSNATHQGGASAKSLRAGNKAQSGSSTKLFQYTPPSKAKAKAAAEAAHTKGYIPPGLKNQAEEEAQFLKYHRCINEGEAYSAAFLITKSHIVQYNTTYNLSMANTELASFLVMETRRSRKPDCDIGAMMQSIDVLDFSVVHLSAYERSLRRHTVVDTEMNAIRRLEKGASDLQIVAKEFWAPSNKKEQEALAARAPEFNRTLAIMPWLGSEIGVGNSKLTHRLTYLQACFWSIYRLIPHIVIGVKTNKDRELVLESAKLPAMSVVVLDEIPSSQALPAALVQLAKQKLGDGSWDFDWLYFTESDQVLLVRQQSEAFDFLRRYPRRVIIPHRLMPYPDEILIETQSRQPSDANINDWLHMNCCLPRQNCEDRLGWHNADSPSLPYLRIGGFQVALGNADYRKEKFRPCVLYPEGGVDVCP